ncbi:MAG: sigma-70 family RNA polymerase sigma factor [Planctomycetota bacterium]
MYESDDFQQLLDRTRQGDTDAMDEIVRKYESDIRIIARAQLGAALRPYMDSVDIVQSVHKSLLNGLQDDKYDIADPKKLIALAAAMVRNKVARNWRKLRRQQRCSGVRLPDSELPDLVVSLVDEAQNPVDQAELRDQVAYALEQLEGVDRQLVVFRLEGHTTVEAAKLLGLNPDVARVRLSRLRRRLKDSKALQQLI